ATDLLLFQVANGLFEGLAHGLLSRLVNTLFQVAERRCCRNLEFERYLNRHRETPSVSEFDFPFSHSMSFSLFLQPRVLGGTMAIQATLRPHWTPSKTPPKTDPRYPLRKPALQPILKV